MESNKSQNSYASQTYWDKRYTASGKDESYEWLENYDTLRGFLKNFLTHKDMKILMLGCGNANFSAHIYDDGYRNITNVDFSEVVIN